MKSLYLLIMVAVLSGPLAANAFEIKQTDPRPRLTLELEPAPPSQRDFDKYVEELAAAARRDAQSPRREKDKIAELQAKAVNPLVLFRW